MTDTALRLPSITLYSAVAGTSVRIAECEVTRAVAAASRWCDLKHLLRLDLLSHPCVYLLAGCDPATGQRCLRIGDVEELRQHKERWDECLRPDDQVFVLTTDAAILGKADIVYWRKRLCGCAWSASRARVVRGRPADPIRLQPARKEMLDLLLAYGRPLLRTAGCRWLQPQPSDARSVA
ncbi:MAG TPA: hypothetical protein VHL09_06220 [Dehalococcoidia bacterium]|nr:hypothetical protein [Dehalococcoidia bacterium]